MNRSKRRVWQQHIYEMFERFDQYSSWFPFPVFLAGSLALLVASKTMLGTSPRLGHPADILTFEAPPAADRAIWFAVTPIGREIVVTTNDRKVFRWPQDLADDEDLEEFRDYLKNRVENELVSAALQKKATTYSSVAIIAADQRLKYLHLKPILYALAEARIRQYSFETILPTKHVAATDPHKTSKHE